ncbi:MAG: efflux RND transporter permease subunit [Selenomonadaceae bacterium]|nr:efflux RND transporter permease subunit [Selenomonadaceae bacterium]
MRNLTEVSLKHRGMVWYFILMIFLGGIFSYQKLGRMEDPAFVVREMVVSVSWPGATALQVEQQVTDKLEQELQDTPGLDHLTSTTRPGVSIIHVSLRDDMPAAGVRDIWKEVRNHCEDIKESLPEGVYGPYYDDRFDDVYGSVFALTADGFSYEEMRDRAQKFRRMLLTLKSVQRVKLLGEQKERVYVELEQAKLSELGISPSAVADALEAQGRMMPAGRIETSSDNVYLRLSGVFDDVEDIRNLPVSGNGKLFRLGDIAKVERRFAEPAEPKMFFNGEPAIGIAVSMVPGENILQLGDDLEQMEKAYQAELPLGLELHQVSDQPQVVEHSIGEFLHTLTEAIVIVLAVSFLSLGLRTGMVVAGCIPLVLAGVFCGMYLFGIDLQKVSLGSLIIALGLLVDDAIIAVEMMSVKLESGFDRFHAACYAFEATAKPMLTGTLITCAGFIPVAFAHGIASEFCSTLFPVISLALVLSWFVSVMVAPLFGYHLIRVEPQQDADGKKDPYRSRFYVCFRRILEWFLTHRKPVLGGTAVLFGISVYMMGFVRQEFFPPSVRPEIMVDLRLPDGSSLQATEAESRKLADVLDGYPELVENYSYYVGTGAPRFVLTINPQLPADNFAQFVIVAKSTEAREELTQKLRQTMAEKLPAARSKLQFLQTGPPADYPIMLRVTGYDPEKVLAIAQQARQLVAQDPNATDVHLDWAEKSKVVHLELDQDKLRGMGLSSRTVAQALYTELTGAKAAQFYAEDRTIDIDLRLAAGDRKDLSKLKELPIYLGSAGYVPLSQIAKISYEGENGHIERRNLKPTVTVLGDIKSGTPNDAELKAYDAVKELRQSLPYGYGIEAGGALEDSGKSLGYLVQPIPFMVFAIMTLLMFQLRNGKQMLLTLLTAPMGIIGVAWGLLLFDKALGFVAYLGILALSGMIIRNSVILIDQIQKHMAEGESPWDAIIDSAVLRFRPILLTAAAAILGMLPLMPSTFWGPMALAIAGGLLAATVLTLLVLPTMYAAVYHVEREA